MSTDPYCEHCLLTVGAEDCNLEHFFCTCVLVKQIWEVFRKILFKIDRRLTLLSNLEVLSLKFSAAKENRTIVWLIGSYVTEVWRIIKHEGSHINKEKFFGYLKFKYRSERLRNESSLCDISELSL